MAIEDGRFRYRGGSIPVPCPPAEPLLRRALAAVPGLRGFVGVDFVWDPARGEAVVLEINPRPTTSFVGLSALLPPGCLARAWLESCGVPEAPGQSPIDLAGIVQAKQAITFDAAGNLRPAEEE
jgi:hypothetical protein